MPFFPDVIYPQVPHWTQFFQSCVSRLLLMLVGSPPTIQDKDRSLDLVPLPGPSENGPSRVTRQPCDPDPPIMTRKVAPLSTPECKLFCLDIVDCCCRVPYLLV